jgi:Na+-driven multidrug efflux pump
MNKNNNKMDLLGNAPVPQALMALGIPIMIGMLINALYNLVDAYFIGGLGESQMGAISIAFPLGQVVVGLGLMFGNGAASYLSRLLGRGDREAAINFAGSSDHSTISIFSPPSSSTIVLTLAPLAPIQEPTASIVLSLL